MSVRVSTGVISLIAAGAADAAVIAGTGSQTAWTLSTGKRAIIRKIRWRNRTGANSNLRIGYGDRTVAGSVFRQVFPDILMLNGIDDGLEEKDLPITGNMREGFTVDTTAITGTLGNIIIGASAVAANDVQVMLEIEEI